MIANSQAFVGAVPLKRRADTVVPAVAGTEPLLRDWLADHREGLFRWTMARAADDAQRRVLAESAVAVQRLRNPAEFITWLFDAALQAALGQARQGGLPEAALAGLVPELRTLLRLVSRGGLRIEEATALLPQRMSTVRGNLLQRRMRGG